MHTWINTDSGQIEYHVSFGLGVRCACVYFTYLCPNIYGLITHKHAGEKLERQDHLSRHNQTISIRSHFSTRCVCDLKWRQTFRKRVSNKKIHLESSREREREIEVLEVRSWVKSHNADNPIPASSSSRALHWRHNHTSFVWLFLGYLHFMASKRFHFHSCPATVCPMHFFYFIAFGVFWSTALPAETWVRRWSAFMENTKNFDLFFEPRFSLRPVKCEDIFLLSARFSVCLLS